jgi:hypothetical protein
MTKLYSLSYYYKFGGKSINALSFKNDILYELHDNQKKNKESMYNLHQNEIEGIVVQPIDIYKYNNKTKNLELINNFHNEDYSLHIINNLDNFPNFHKPKMKRIINYYLEDTCNELECNVNNYSETIILLSKNDYNDWINCLQTKNTSDKFPNYFYTELISKPLKLDTYYEEGIIFI